MKKSKRILGLLLVLSMCFTLASASFAAEGENQAVKHCPTVFVHGLFGWGADDGCDELLPYWGMGSGSVFEYLEAQGYEDIASASVGPISSAWDRCCELFAQLTGTRVDYGLAHIKKTLSEFKKIGCKWNHSRYGRDYTGKAVVQNWGPEYDDEGTVIGWYDTRINLVGHSFGGPTVVMFLDLLARGDENEREIAKKEAVEKTGDENNWKDYCSPLFWGDCHGEKLVNSLTSLAGVLNGTTFIDSCDTSTEMITDAYLTAANLLGDTGLDRVYDIQLDQFGITSGEITDRENIGYTMDLLQASHFLDGKDNAIYDLSIEGCNELKQGWECYPEVYYFAYAGCTTHESLGGRHIPNANTWALFLGFATFMGSYTNPDEVVLDTKGNEFCRIDAEWLQNDGMVNTVTAGYVFGCPQKDWDGEVEPGLWITMPLNGFDHFDYCGGILEPTQNASQTRAFYDDVMKNIEATYQNTGRLSPPTVEAAVTKLLAKRIVTLSFRSDGSDSYKVYRAASEDGCYRLMTTTACTSFTDITVVRGHTYYYRVTACRNGNASAGSDFSRTLSVQVK